MEILKFNDDNKSEYKYFINKYNNVKEFYTLKVQTFDTEKKKIFLLVEKGVLKKYKIIAYAIIEEELKYLYITNSISEEYLNDGTTIYISDFMVRRCSRKQGIGTYLAKYLIEDVYRDKNIILQPDGDGFLFWKKFNFKQDEISKNETWKKIN